MGDYSQEQLPGVVKEHSDAISRLDTDFAALKESVANAKKAAEDAGAQVERLIKAVNKFAAKYGVKFEV